MKTAMFLNAFLPDAPAASCWSYDAGNIIVCTAKAAKGAAQNKFSMTAKVAAVALETDGKSHRFPPNSSLPVCDWCVFAQQSLNAYFVELKGSDFVHAVEQIERTLDYMARQYRLHPVKAFAVLSGAHPSNTRPGKANAKAKFLKRHPAVLLCERSPGQEKPEDIIT